MGELWRVLRNERLWTHRCRAITGPKSGYLDTFVLSGELCELALASQLGLPVVCVTAVLLHGSRIPLFLLAPTVLSDRIGIALLGAIRSYPFLSALSPVMQNAQANVQHVPSTVDAIDTVWRFR